MFGIGAGEFIFIALIILMFFGSDKIPEMARALGKGMAHLKNATNDIKTEIHNNVGDVDVKSLTGGISEEINKAKQGFTQAVMNSEEQANLKSELDMVREKLASAESELAASQNIELPNPEETPDAPEPVKRNT